MMVTLSGMIIAVREVQESNAPLPMVVILLGIVNVPVVLAGHVIKVVRALLYSTPSTLA